MGEWLLINQRQPIEHKCVKPNAFGIKEKEADAGSVWMCECGEQYELFFDCGNAYWDRLKDTRRLSE